MSFRRKAERRQAQATPASESELRGAMNRARKALSEILPGRGWVLVSAPGGVPLDQPEHVTSATNMDRDVAGRLLSGLLDWWRPDGHVVQPDQDTVAALREMVHSLRGVSLIELASGLPHTVEHLSGVIGGQRPAKEIHVLAMQAAVEALAILDRVAPNVMPRPDGISVDGGSVDGGSAYVRAHLELLPSPKQWVKGNTKETLVRDLEALPPSKPRDMIIEVARRGGFHDFDSEHPTPKMFLVEALMRAGFLELAGKARDGGYDDEHATIEQAEEMRAEVGPELYDGMMGGKRRPVS